MKKKNGFSAILIFLFVSVAVVNAQTGSGGGSGGIIDSYGIKASIISSAFSSNFQKLENTESRTSLSAGIFANFRFSDYLGVSIDGLYVQEGTMQIDPHYIYYDSRVSPAGSELTINRVNSNVLMHNFEVPLLLNVYIPDNEFNPKVMVGGSFDYIYSVYAYNLLAYSTGGESYVVSDRAMDNVTSSFKSYNIGLVLGAGISYEMISLDIRYKLGMQPINNLATFNYRNYSKEDFTTNVLMIGIGLNINKL